MVTEVILPKLGQTMEEGTIVEWFKKEGDPVKRGELLFTVESDKATLEVEATSRGFLRKILVPAGETVPVMTVVALMTHTVNEDIGGYKVEGLRVRKLEKQELTIKPATFEPATLKPTMGRLFASPRARKVARGRGVDLPQVVGSGPHGRIVERDVLAYLESRPKAMPTAVRVAAALGKVQSLRDSFKFMNGNILVLTITQVLGMFCRSMVFPYASLYILALGGEPAQIGLINSLKPLAGLIMFPIAGYIADRAGRVKLIALGGYLSGSILLLYVLAPSWEAIALAGLLQGFVVFQFPPTSAIIADSLPPQNRGKGIATMNTVSGALAMFSPYLAGAILDIYGENAGMRLLYGVMMVVYLVSATINLRFLRETSARAKEKLGFSSLPRAFKNAYGGIPAMLRQLPRSLRVLAVVIVLGFTSNAIASSFWVVYAKEHIGLASKEWGLILLIETLLRSLLNIPSGMVVDCYGRTKFILASLLLSLVSIPLFVFSSSLIQVLLVRSVIAVANAFFTPACSALMADTVPRDMRGRVMAAIGRGAVMLGAASGGTGGPGMGFLVTLPVILGSIAGGYLYGHNPAVPWFFVLGTTTISVLLSALFLRDPKQAEI